MVSFIQVKCVRMILIMMLTVLVCVTAGAQEPLWNNLNARVRELSQQGRYSEAVKVAEEALKVAKGTFSPDDPQAAMSLNNLADLYKAQGKSYEANRLYEQALDHPEPTRRMNGLTELYRAQGRYADLGQLYNESLPIIERNSGAGNPKIVLLLEKMAEFQKRIGNNSEAERILQRVKKLKPPKKKGWR